MSYLLTAGVFQMADLIYIVHTYRDEHGIAPRQQAAARLSSMDIIPSLSAYPLQYILLASLPAILLWRKKKSSRSSLPLPPGPKRWPIVGNFFNFPSQGKHWLVYDKLFKQYGSLCCITFGARLTYI